MWFTCSETILHLQFLVCPQTRQGRVLHTVDWRGKAFNTGLYCGSATWHFTYLTLRLHNKLSFIWIEIVWRSAFSFSAAHPQFSRGHGHRVPSPTRFALQTCLEEPDRRPPQTDHPGQWWENGFRTAALFHGSTWIETRKLDHCCIQNFRRLWSQT